MFLQESKVNFKKLINDLAEMYTDPVHEVIVSELVANSLDARASRIEISYVPEEKCLIIKGNGEGMTSKQFEEYHNFAAELKTRGNTIGFAGLGAKISFRLAKEIITETYSQKYRGRSRWYWYSSDKLVWELEEPKELTRPGTLVKIFFKDDFDSERYSAENIKKILLKTIFLYSIQGF
jgi:HSP90 family molecular chaperone